MAEGKKAFIVYTDWIKYTNEMTNEQKGLWIDWCLKYCTDTNPDFPEDPTAKFLCMLCQDILKRDLKKYEEKKERFMKIGKQYNNNDNENEKETTPNTESNTKPKTESVNSNKLLVNSNKYISNDILKEEEKIDNLKNFLSELEQLLGYAITGKKGDIACKLYEEYGYKTAMYEIRKNIDKQSPIAYTYTALTNNRPKNENTTSGSEWWDNTKREPEEKDKGSEWLENFKKQMEDKQ